jgi:hypothetical protein
MKKYLKYQIAGKTVPSVTTVLGVLDKEGLTKWYGRLGLEEAERQKNEAADFGSKVHAAIEAVYSGQDIELTDDRFSKAVLNFKKWAEYNI